MCLTARCDSGDSGGDWELVLPERRPPPRRPPPCVSPGSKGNRFSHLAAAVAEAEGSAQELSDGESCEPEDVEARPLPLAPSNLGRFWPERVDGPPLVLVSGSSRERSISPAPPPPLSSPSHFPPLPGLAPVGRGLSEVGREGSGSGLIRIGALVLELPSAMGRPEAGGTPPPLGFAPPLDAGVLGSVGPAGPAHGRVAASPAQWRFGPAQGAVNPGSAGAPGSDPLDARHVAPAVDGRLGGTRVPRWDGSAPPPPTFKWLWLPPKP
jgi:hypothetical protein